MSSSYSEMMMNRLIELMERYNAPDRIGITDCRELQAPDNPPADTSVDEALMWCYNG